jgi:tetratricopeptide (TPR) repeat protein
MIVAALGGGCAPKDAPAQKEYSPAAVAGQSDETELRHGIKVLALFISAIAILVGGPLTAIILKRRAKKQRLTRARRQAEMLLSSDHPDDALKIIEAARRESLDRKSREVWRGLKMDVFEKTKDIEGLRDMFWHSPRLFVEREPAALAVARAEVEEEHFETFTTLRNAWRGREQTPEEWLSLDVDLLIREGKGPDALDLLTKNRFDGAKDCARAARYALLRAQQDVPHAGVLLAEALEVDPRSPDVHLCRALYLEMQGKQEEALPAYRTAVDCAPQDMYLVDRLAEACRRNGDYEEALRIWRDAIEPPSMGFIWLKTLFWTRVGLAVPISWKGRTPPRGHLRPLIEFILQLDEDRFWDTRAFAATAERQPELLSRQETFWLRVLEALRTCADGEALSLLNLQGFGVRSWHPPLENALLRIVICRLRGFLGTSVNPDLEVSMFPKPDHPFFTELEEWTQHSGITVPEEAKHFLQSDYVFAAACFAVGWWEAGLRLLRTPELPADAPPWLKRDLEEAVRRHGDFKHVRLG